MRREEGSGWTVCHNVNSSKMGWESVQNGHDGTGQPVTEVWSSSSLHTT